MKKLLQLALVLAFASVINGEQAPLEDTEDLRELVPLVDEGLQETFDSEVSPYVTSVRTHL